MLSRLDRLVVFRLACKTINVKFRTKNAKNHIWTPNFGGIKAKQKKQDNQGISFINYRISTNLGGKKGMVGGQGGGRSAT